jgi:hypothetical protein
VQTMRRRSTREFRDLYRKVDLLVLDDVHLLAGKRGTERELCFTTSWRASTPPCKAVCWAGRSSRSSRRPQRRGGRSSEPALHGSASASAGRSRPSCVKGSTWTPGSCSRP